MYRTLYDQEEDVDTVAIITTGEFTPQGSRLAKKLNVEVVDGRQLCNLIDEYAPDIEEVYFKKSRETEAEESNQPESTKYDALFCRRLTEVSDAFTGRFRQANREMDAVCRYGIAQTAHSDVS